jgi:predicted MPP superfamily phosphohydrolase
MQEDLLLVAGKTVLKSHSIFHGRNPGLIFRFTVRLMCFVIFALLMCGLYAYAIEPRLVMVREVSVPIENLPDNLVGFTIGVMADLHLEITPQATVRSAAERLAALEPDITVAVGDFAEGASRLADISYALEPLGVVYGVPGNWDRWTEVPGDAALMDIDMLTNRGVSPMPGIWLCGIDDALLGFPSIDEAVSGAPEGAVRILLAHEPDVATWVEPHHGITLQISGHSHGGQIRLPYIGPVLLPPLGRMYPSGLAQAPTHWVYTTRGVGMSHIPVRFLCPPEVTLLTLVRP